MYPPIEMGGFIAPPHPLFFVKEVEESGSDFLAGLLHREPALNMLPPGTIQELIEGRGDVEEAARAIAMDFLGRF
jgi:hypothetical protein